MFKRKLATILIVVLSVMTIAIILRNQYIEQSMIFPTFTEQEIQTILIEENI